MHKSRELIRTACKELDAQFKVINQRDLATPSFDKLEPAMASMAKLDHTVKQLFVTVLRCPEKLGRAPASVIRFVHESMDFVENGKKRSINIEEWDKVIRSSIETEYGTSRALSMGPTGPKWMHSDISIGKTTLFKPHDSVSGVKEVSTCLLLHKWLQREQGLTDALISYRLLAMISEYYSH